MKKIFVPICFSVILFNVNGCFFPDKDDCSEGDTICYEGYTNTCINHEWIVGTECNSAAACFDGDRVCSYGEAPNVCSGGVWHSEGRCPVGESCSNGHCMCHNGDRLCDEYGIPWECKSGTWVEYEACADGEICIEGICSCDTAIPSSCADSQTVLSCESVDGAPATWTEFECMEDEYCENGECRCKYELAEICGEDGTPWKCVNHRWEAQELCGQGETCVEGRCVCTPGETRCIDSQHIELCTNQGKWIRDMCGDQMQCSDGQCRCIENAKTCLNGEPMICSGGSWAENTACPANTVCYKGSCVCPENHKKCVGINEIHACINHNYVLSSKCTETQICRDGRCICSAPGTNRCADSKTVLTCTPNNDWTTLKTCGNGYSCKDGQCICNDGLSVCTETGDVKTCQNGKWSLPTQCTDMTSCRSGKCVCTESTKRCSDDGIPMICKNGSWKAANPCQEHYSCSEGLCKCTENAMICTADGKPMICQGGSWKNNGTCDQNSACHEGKCICNDGAAQCTADGRLSICRQGNWEISDCEAGTVCSSGKCEDASCTNGLWDDGEDAVDCGGTCAPCKTCRLDSDDCPEGYFCDAASGSLCRRRCTADTECRESSLWNGEYCRADGRCSPKVFETVWTVAGSTTIVLPVQNDAVCNFKVIWGDETSAPDIESLAPVTDCTDAAKRTHIYEKAGTYHIRIIGIYDGWSMTEPMPELTGIASFGPVGLGAGAFNGTQITSLPERDIPDASKLTTLAGCFMHSSFNLPLNWDTANVTDMSHMFDGAAQFNQPLAHLSYKKLAKADDMLKDSGIDTDNYCALIALPELAPFAAVLGLMQICK